jgi:hypothetical protein
MPALDHTLISPPNSRQKSAAVVIIGLARKVTDIIACGRVYPCFGLCEHARNHEPDREGDAKQETWKMLGHC